MGDSHNHHNEDRSPSSSICMMYRGPQHHQYHRLQNILTSSFVWLVLCGSSIAINLVLEKSQENQIRNNAARLADDTGRLFAKELDLAILPLFSLAQFAVELDLFRQLPEQIGPAGGVKSLPFLHNGTTTTHHRNTTGVCDDDYMMQRYDEIASQIITHANMDGVLHNIQLAPYGVICLVHPMINRPPNGNFNNTGIVGLDILNDPFHQYIARQTLTAPDAKVAIVGPRPLNQCPTCGLYFIVRLPIVSDDDVIILDGVDYPRWGFATALINWDELVQRLGVYQQFLQGNFEFRLTRKDYIFNQEKDNYEPAVVTLAQSDYFDQRKYTGIVSTALQTTNNEWVITVQYLYDRDFSELIWFLCFAVPCCIGFLLYTVLQQRQRHSYMLAQTEAQNAKLELERDMTAYFAHELRNPLSAIDSALVSLEVDEEEVVVGVVVEGNPSQRLTTATRIHRNAIETRELLDSMRICTLFMKNLLNNLLDARQLEEGKMTLKIEALSLNDLLESVVRMARPSVKPGVDLRKDVQTNESNDIVVGDHHRLQQILINVVSNAIKYTCSGTIILSVAIPNTNTSSTCSQLVRFECCDTGIGIPLTEQGKLFQRFAQRGGAPGTGLGLNIALNLAKLMNGTITIESDPTIAPGTTFVIEIPLPPSMHRRRSFQSCASTEPTTMSTSVSPKGSDKESDHNDGKDIIHSVGNNGNNPIGLESVPTGDDQLEQALRILLVDDMKINRSLLKKRFITSIAPKSTVIEASTGEECLLLVEQEGEEFDVIVMDQFMSDAGGVLLGTDTIIALRYRLKQTRPVIIGCSGNDLQERFMEAGADLVWEKPVPSNSTILTQLRSQLLLKQNNNYRNMEQSYRIPKFSREFLV